MEKRFNLRANSFALAISFIIFKEIEITEAFDLDLETA